MKKKSVRISEGPWVIVSAAYIIQHNYVFYMPKEKDSDLNNMIW